MDLGPAQSSSSPVGGTLPESAWIQPVPDHNVLPANADPADLAVSRDSVRLAFVAALQHLPPQQRAVLILREVLSWRAAEVADLLGTSVAAVNSALQRARATLAARDLEPMEPQDPMDDADRELLARYLDAFERYDMDELTSLLHEDATQSMPPYELWLRGRDDILGWWTGTGAGCKGSRLIPTQANGQPAFAQYRPSGPGGAYEPWSLQVLRIEKGKIVELTFFLDTERLFPLFGVPAHPEQ
jgi:RNA polymerase sigma-70 factor, ECF subfamily